MLSPRYLDGLSDEIIEIYSQLETDILQDMARRIARLGKITDATRWQAQMLTEAGGLQEHIRKTLKKYDAKTVRAVTAVYKEALEKNAANDNRIFSEALGRTISAPNTQAMLSTIQKCHSDLSRLTLTTAATSQQQFVREANRVYMNVQSGAFGYDTAMKDAADALAKRGITTVQYENGRPVTRTIESAVRMNILTSINQTAANQTLSNAEELGVEKFEVTAHIGARPDHEAWQGKIYTKEELTTICGLGAADGLCGINCRHSFYPYFEGMEKHYTQDDLDEMAGERVTYTDKDGNTRTMTRYEAEQRERQIERNIRHYKRKALTEEAAGADSTRTRRKLGEWQAAARDFTAQTGIARDSAREHVGTSGSQPRGITPQTKTATHGTTPTSPTTTDATAKAMATLVDSPKSETRTLLEKSGVEARTVLAFDKPKTEAEIISRIAGGDMTKGGSCSSVALAYTANKAGFDVLDFRDGLSKSTFAKRSTIQEIANLNGVKSKIVEKINDFSAAHELYRELETGKQYYLAVGSHAAIIQKKGDVLQWLEMQSADTNRNTWHILDDSVLKWRFDCQQSRSHYRKKYAIPSILIDIESLGNSKEFIKLMKYINTSESAQIKGAGGYAK